MASSINYSSIDADYPIAGKDNDSQGFRDNFGYIKDSLQAAKGEIETLQLTTAKTNADNDFNSQKISQARFIDCSEVVNQKNAITDTDTIIYSEGSVAIIQLSASAATVTLSGFPSTLNAGRLRVHITSQANVSRTVTFQASAGTIKKTSTTSNPVTVASATNHTVIDFWSYDGGSTVFMNLVGVFS
jgi:hypothetical protein